LKPNVLYTLERPGESFSGYEKVEAIGQVQDTVASICAGEVGGLEGWKGSSWKEEYEIQPPISYQVQRDINFPIRADAILMNGAHWCVIEGKHEVTLQDVNILRRNLISLATTYEQCAACRPKTFVSCGQGNQVSSQKY
jgi:hypothetical protein